MKELKMKLNNRMLELDETTNIITMLTEENEKLVKTVKVISYYLDDNTNEWTEMPIFSIVAWYDNYDIVHHHLGSEVFNDIYKILVKRNLVENIEN